jgi:hypothetical protein
MRTASIGLVIYFSLEIPHVLIQIMCPLPLFTSGNMKFIFFLLFILSKHSRALLGSLGVADLVRVRMDRTSYYDLLVEISGLCMRTTPLLENR